MRRRDFLLAPLSAAAVKDPDRPRFHLMPPSGWMNDPNGPIWHDGEFHLFYQHNPHGAWWDTMHWGHAASRDLIHWRHLPIALAPTAGGPDKDGCFSGCAVMQRGRPAFIYTGVRPEVQCKAVTADGLYWTLDPRRPVIAGPPPGLDTPGFRDPQVWREGNRWRMVLGAGVRNKGGAVLLYSSPDLERWEYEGRLLEGAIDPAARTEDPVGRGEMWECPDFFPVGSRWLLYVATQGKVLYWLGRWDGARFTPESNGVLGHGALYAPKSAPLGRKRQVIWGWLRETRPREAQLRAGWSGVMSLPLVPSTGRDGRLRLDPAREVERLRHGSGASSLEGIPAAACELEFEFDPARDVTLERGGRPLFSWIARTRTARAGDVHVVLEGVEGRVRLFCDASVTEAFVDGAYLAARTYEPGRYFRWVAPPARLRAWPLRM